MSAVSGPNVTETNHIRTRCQGLNVSGLGSSMEEATKPAKIAAKNPAQYLGNPCKAPSLAEVKKQSTLNHVT